MNALVSTPVRAILIAGSAAGALDIAYAMLDAVRRGRSAIRPVQAVASGILGAPAFDGGAKTFLLGLALHFFIAITAAGVYYLASGRLPLLRERVMLPATAFGIAVYLVMNFAVLPLSRVPFSLSHSPATLLTGFVSHVLLVGLPVAVVTRAAWNVRREAATRPTLR
jgi:hypothetical protein